MLPADRSRHAHRPGPGRPPVSPLDPDAPSWQRMATPAVPAMEHDDRTFSTDSAAGGLMSGRYVFLTEPSGWYRLRNGHLGRPEHHCGPAGRPGPAAAHAMASAGLQARP